MLAEAVYPRVDVSGELLERGLRGTGRLTLPAPVKGQDGNATRWEQRLKMLEPTGFARPSSRAMHANHCRRHARTHRKGERAGKDGTVDALDR